MLQLDSEVLQQKSPPIQAEIISQTPGRIRLRVANLHRKKKHIEPLAGNLNKHLAIYRVRTNIPSGSLTVFHAKEHLSSEDLKAVLRDLGIIFKDIAEAEAKLVINEGNSGAAMELSNAVFDLNQRVKQASNGIVDLRFLFPFSLSLLALRQLLVKGWQFDLIPWYVLAWYAFDSFLKLNGGKSEELRVTND
jgi:hypothetical protein